MFPSIWTPCPQRLLPLCYFPQRAFHPTPPSPWPGLEPFRVVPALPGSPGCVCIKHMQYTHLSTHTLPYKYTHFPLGQKLRKAQTVLFAKFKELKGALLIAQLASGGWLTQWPPFLMVRPRALPGSSCVSTDRQGKGCWQHTEEAWTSSLVDIKGSTWAQQPESALVRRPGGAGCPGCSPGLGFWRKHFSSKGSRSFRAGPLGPPFTLRTILQVATTVRTHRWGIEAQKGS